MSWWAVIQEIVEFMYHLAGIGLLVGVGLAYWQLMILRKDLNTRNIRAAKESSMKYLRMFSKELLPMYGRYYKKLKEEIPKPDTADDLYDGKFNLPIEVLSKELLAETIVKQELDLTDFLNELEFFSAAMLNGLTDEDVIYTPVSKVFCKIVRSEHVLISVLRNRGTPYQNLVSLYENWSNRIEVDELTDQIEKAEHKIKQKGNRYKKTPSIGQ